MARKIKKTAKTLVALSADDILKRCKRKTKTVEVPALGEDFAVSILAPNPHELYELRSEAQEQNLNDKDFIENLFKKSLNGWTDEQLEELKELDGFKYDRILAACIPHLMPFAAALSAENMEKQKKS